MQTELTEYCPACTLPEEFVSMFQEVMLVYLQPERYMVFQ